MTALVSVLIGAGRGRSVGVDGMETALGAFGMFIPFSDRALSVSVIIFAFCTMICWDYYGSESIAYLGLRHAGKVYPFIFAAAAVTGIAVRRGCMAVHRPFRQPYDHSEHGLRRHVHA